MFSPITLPYSLESHDFKALQRKEKNPRMRIRLLAMAQLKAGIPYKEVAQMLCVHEKTLLKWIHRFKQEGLDGLQEKKGRGAKPRLKQEQHEAFKQAVLERQASLPGGRLKGEDVRKLLAETFNVELSLSRTYDLLHIVGLSWVSSRSRHPKADPEAQEALKKNFVELATEVLPPEIDHSQVDIWFQDEARIGQQNTTTRLWAEIGTRPRAIRQQQFESAYLFGATCAAQGQAVGLVLPCANTEAMRLHIQAISQAVPHGRHALLLVDGALWHNSKACKDIDNVSLFKIPPASPELNPIEQVWQYLRQNKLANRCFENYTAIVDACCEAWNWFEAQPQRIKQLTSRDWASLVC